VKSVHLSEAVFDGGQVDAVLVGQATQLFIQQGLQVRPVVLLLSAGSGICFTCLSLAQRFLETVLVAAWVVFRFLETRGRSSQKENIMPVGSKARYTGNQKRKAEHIAEGYEKRGVSTKEAKRRAYATVNKESGGGKKSGSGRGHSESHESSRKGGKKGGSH
jgi:plasmid stabilization system protein ParE